MSNISSILFNTLLFAPASIVLSKIFYYLLACPCLVSHEHDKYLCCCVRCLELCGKLIAYPFALMLILLVIPAAIYSSGNGGSTIAKYAYQVHVIATFEDILWHLSRAYTGTQYYGIVVGDTEIICIGSWFNDYIQTNSLVVGQDYIERRYYKYFVSRTALNANAVIAIPTAPASVLSTNINEPPADSIGTSMQAEANITDNHYTEVSLA